MGTPEEKVKHSKRIRKKKVERTRSVIAKELLVSGKDKQRIVKDKRGKKHDLASMKFIDLVEAIQE